MKSGTVSIHVYVWPSQWLNICVQCNPSFKDPHALLQPLLQPQNTCLRRPSAVTGLSVSIETIECRHEGATLLSVEFNIFPLHFCTVR